MNPAVTAAASPNATETALLATAMLLATARPGPANWSDWGEPGNASTAPAGPGPGPAVNLYGDLSLEDDYNASMNCTNEYCVDDQDYYEMVKQHIYPLDYEWGLIAMHSVVFVVGLVGNALVCVAVYRNHTMRTVTNYFIVNLAVADFMVILFCLPPTVLWDVTETWFMGTFCCKVVVYLQTVSVAVSVLTLTFISVDRWYAICFPLKFKSTTSRAKTAIIVIWLLSLAFDIPEMVVLEAQQRDWSLDTILLTSCVARWDSDTEMAFYTIKAMLLYTCPLVFMSVAYCQIVRVLWRSDNIPGHSETVKYQSAYNSVTAASRRAAGLSTPACNVSTEGQLRSRRKAAKMLVAVVVMFAICYLPVNLLNILRYIVVIPSNHGTIALSMLSHWLCYANSAINPIIYNFMSGKFRQEFKRAFLHCGCFRAKGAGLPGPGQGAGYRSTAYHRAARSGASVSAATSFTLAAPAAYRPPAAAAAAAAAAGPGPVRP